MSPPLNPPLSPRTPPPPPLPSPPARPKPAHILPPALSSADDHDFSALEPARNNIMSPTSVEAPALSQPMPSRPAPTSLLGIHPVDASIDATTCNDTQKLTEFPPRPESSASGVGSGTASGSQTVVASDNEQDTGTGKLSETKSADIARQKHVQELDKEREAAIDGIEDRDL